MKKQKTNFLGISFVTLTVALLLATGCRSAPTPSEVQPSEELIALSETEFGESRKTQAAWEARVRAANPGDYHELEREMLWLLEAPTSSFEAKQFACRILRQVGGESSLPTLAELLADEQLSHPARFALQGIESPEVDELLRDALAKLEGEPRCGVIDTIAYRGDREAVPDLAAVLLDPDRNTVRSAIEALGRLGGDAAATALSAPLMDDGLRVVQLDARLACADSLLAEGEPERASELYRELVEPGIPVAYRVAAWRGVVRANPETSITEIVGLFEATEPELRRAAARFTLDLPAGTDVTRLATKTSDFEAEAQILALGALAERGAAVAVPSALAALESGDEGVRVAGLKALGRLGSAEYVPRIASFLAKDTVERGAARRALESSSSEGVDEAIAAQLEASGEDRVRAELIACLVSRRSSGSVPTLLALAETGEERTRSAAIEGLEKLAEEDNLPEALALAAKLERPRDRRAMEAVLLAICERAEAREDAVAVLAAAGSRGTAPARVSILRVLGEMPSGQTLVPLRAAAADGDVEVRHAAVLALAAWPDAAPGELLQTIWREEEEERVRLAALQGCLRMSASESAGEEAAILAAYRDAYDLARTPEEKQVVVECARRSEQLWAVGFLDTLREDAEVGALAGETWEALCTVLARKVGHDAVDAPVTLVNAPVEKYAANGSATLTDGQWGSTEHGDGKWIGFNGEDLIATIDLGEVIEVTDVRVGFLRGQRSWIFPPASVELSLSDDGQAFRVLSTLEVDGPKPSGKTEWSDAFARFEGERARFLKVHVVHPGILPKWHPGSGEPSWLFVDEIAVNARYEP